MRDIAFPIVNLNGDKKETLVRQNLEALDALHKARGRLQDAAPHGRNFQNSPEGEFQLAASDHVRRLRALAEIIEEIEAIALNVSNQ